MSSLDISLESPGTPGAFFYVGGEGGASSKPEGRPVARRAALQKRKAPLRAGLRLKREPRPSVCGEVAPAQAGALVASAGGVLVLRRGRKPLPRANPMFARYQRAVGSIHDSGTAKIVKPSVLAKAPHRTKRKLLRWSVGHRRDPRERVVTSPGPSHLTQMF